MVKFYQVGGSVRDELLGVKSKDIDYSVVANSFDEMRQAIIDLGGKIYLETPEYFTIRANVPKFGSCDYVLARKEGAYYDGRHPEKVEVGTIFDDLARRDFTINAIAKDEDGNYIDPHNGIFDLRLGLIDTVGNAEDRFNEDGLRILRALRFAVTKNFTLSARICEYITFNNIEDKLRGVSVERIREELFKMFKFNTLRSAQILVKDHPQFSFLLNGALWLKPTLEER